MTLVHNDHLSRTREIEQKSAPEHRAGVAKRIATDVAEALSSGRPVVFCFDFDGTLSDLVLDPEKAVMARAAVKVLRDLLAASGVTVVITTGRPREFVQKVLAANGLEGVELRCSYDAEQLSYRDGKAVEWDHPQLADSAERLAKAEAVLERHLKKIMKRDGEVFTTDTDVAVREGILYVERKPGRMAIHFIAGSEVNEHLKSQLHKALDAASAEMAQFGLVPDPIRPTLYHANEGNYELVGVDCSKDKSVEPFLVPGAVVVYSGDDRGDIPAVEVVLESRGAATAGPDGEVRYEESRHVLGVNNTRGGKGRVPDRMVVDADALATSPTDLAGLVGEVIRQVREINPALMPIPHRTVAPVFLG